MHIRPVHSLLLAGVVGTALLAGSAPATADNDGIQQAELVGRAVLPAETFGVAIPSGSAITAANGVAVPFAAQPVQGFSGVLPQADGSYLVVSDNGYGSKANSADYLLRVNRVKADYATGTVSLLDGFGLSDPANKVPWALTRPDRRLTGADFDLESFRVAPDGTFWFGEEFGPFLLHTDAQGRLLDAPVPLPGVRSPQNPLLAAGEVPNLGASKGFEGMALSADGRYLLPMLEGAVAGDSPQDLRVYKYDLRRQRYKGIEFRYRLEHPGNAIGDMTTVDRHRYLVLERDNGQGATARFKAVFLVDSRDRDKDGYADKQLLVNLMAVPDPKGVSGTDAFFTFPFVTIEGIAVLDDHTILVENDNNFPFSSGRTPGKPDDDEFIKIRLDQSLTD